MLAKNANIYIYIYKHYQTGNFLVGMLQPFVFITCLLTIKSHGQTFPTLTLNMKN